MFIHVFSLLKVLSHYFIFGKGTCTGCPPREIESDLLASRIQSWQDNSVQFLFLLFSRFPLVHTLLQFIEMACTVGGSSPTGFDHKKNKGGRPESILSYHSLQSRPSLSHLITTLLFPFILFRIPCPTPFKRKSTSTVCLKAPCMSLIKSFFKLESSYRQNIIFLSTFPINENKILKMKNCSHQCKVIPSHQI